MQKFFNILSPVVFLILGIFLYKGCEDQKQQHAEAVAQLQQIVHWQSVADSASEREKAAIMGWQMDTVKWVAEKTQLIALYSSASKAVDTSKAVIRKQVIKYDAAKAVHDTSGQLGACDSMRQALTKANIAVNDLQTSSETIATAYGNEIQERDSTINILAGQIITKDKAIDSIAEVGKNAAKKNATLTKPKHWNVSIGGTTTIIAGKVQEIIGIHVGYSIINF